MKPWRKFKGKSLAACEGTFSIYTRQEFWINLNRFNGYISAFFGSLVGLALWANRLVVANGTDILRSFREKQEKRNTSEGIPFFLKNFQWKGLFHFISHQNNRFFHTNGKRSVFLLLTLDGMLVHRRVTPSIKFTGIHWRYTCMERGTAKVTCLAQEHNTVTRARAQTLTTWCGVQHTSH